MGLTSTDRACGPPAFLLHLLPSRVLALSLAPLLPFHSSCPAPTWAASRVQGPSVREGGTEPSGPPALGPSPALADLGPFLLDFQGHLGSHPAPSLPSVSPSPGHLFRGESFLLLQLLSQAREIQLWFWGKQLCQESGVNDRLHLEWKEEAVSSLGRSALGGGKAWGKCD